MKKARKELLMEASTLCEKHTLATADDIYEELVSLNKEFDTFEIDLEQGALFLTTEPIVTEGVHLGRMRIRFIFKYLSNLSDNVYIEPLDPELDEEGHFHPAVSDGYLCTGNGYTAVKDAGRHGRLYEAFVTVITILKSNAYDGYSHIKYWRKSKCYNCNAIIKGDVFVCPDCERKFHIGCITKDGKCHSCAKVKEKVNV